LTVCVTQASDRTWAHRQANRRADRAIDEIRKLIAGGFWEEALEELDSLESNNAPDGLRQQGLSLAGFFARRTYVTEQIVDLLAAKGEAEAALEHVERIKARALLDILQLHRISSPTAHLTPQLAKILLSWPKGLVAFEYFFSSDNAWLFVVGGRSQVSAYRLADEEGAPLAPRNLVTQVNEFISGLDRLGPVEGRRIAYAAVTGRQITFDHNWQHDLHRLYRTLIQPEAVAQCRGATTLLIVPHHILHYFPFAALVTHTDPCTDDTRMPLPTFLIEEPFNLTYAASLSTWYILRQAVNRPIEDVRAIGIVDFAGRAPRLDGVTKEVTTLKEVFGDRVHEVFTNEKATKSNVLRLLKESGLLYVATHGQKLPNAPLDSYLVCRDQANRVSHLTAADIYTAPVKCDLVLLDACYGGFADRSPMPTDDLYGIQRALLQSGARAVVSGQWDIYDATAPDIMREVFVGIFEGKPAPQSLAIAQRKYLAQWRRVPQEPLRFLTHPYYWAVFTVAGDDRVGGNTEASQRHTSATTRTASE